MNEMLYYDLRSSSGLSSSLATQVTREMGRRIVAGSWRQGDLIEDEAALATRFGVSRSVVRDAVKILVGKGMLEVRRGIGTRVRPRQQWGLLDDDVLAWHLSAPVSADFLSQLMDMRRIVEPKAARWAAEHGSDDDLARIAEAQARMEDEKGAIEDFVIADAQYHKAILAASSNEFLRAMEGLIYSALLSSIRITNADPRDNETSLPIHAAVTRAILDRDPDAAEARMGELLSDARARQTTARR